MIHSLSSLALPCNQWIIVVSVSVVVRLVENLSSCVLLCASWVLARNIFLKPSSSSHFCRFVLVRNWSPLRPALVWNANEETISQKLSNWWPKKTRHLLFSLLLVYNKLKFGQNWFRVDFKWLESWRWKWGTLSIWSNICRRVRPGERLCSGPRRVLQWIPGLPSSVRGGFDCLGSAVAWIGGISKVSACFFFKKSEC